MNAISFLRVLTVVFAPLMVAGAVSANSSDSTKTRAASRDKAERIEHFPNGRVKAQWHERTLADGSVVKHGIFQNYYDNGQLKSQVEFVYGKESGLMTTWQNDGKLISTLSYKNGLLDGICTYYDTDGRKMSSGTFSNGKENGVFTLYYQSGKIQGKTTWKDGVHHGPFEVWWENGKMAKLGQTKDGLVDGHWKVWDSTGKLTLEEEYLANVLIKSIKHDSTIAPLSK